jgi:endo-1,3-1,4-beta-glycanase ExoK
VRPEVGIRWTVLALGIACCLVAPTRADAKPYKGAEVFSQQLYQYGRLEIRMRMARGSGLVSTFFTFKNGSDAADTAWEEIDIEVLGKDDATGWQSNLITGAGTRITSEQVHTETMSLADDYHTYVVVWTPDFVAWELDGKEVRRSTSQVQDLTNAHSLRFNLWPAGIPGWVGDFDDSVLPQYQFVNWISYSRYQDGEFIHEWTESFDTFDESKWGRGDWTFDESLADFDPNNVVVQDGTLVLALTREGMTGFSGQVPVDQDMMSGTGGASNGSEAGAGGADSDAGGAASFGGAAGAGTGGQVPDSSGSGGASGSTGGSGLGSPPVMSGGMPSTEGENAAGGATTEGENAAGGATTGGENAAGVATTEGENAAGVATGNTTEPSPGEQATEPGTEVSGPAETGVAGSAAGMSVGAEAVPSATAAGPAQPASMNKGLGCSVARISAGLGFEGAPVHWLWLILGMFWRVRRRAIGVGSRRGSPERAAP